MSPRHRGPDKPPGRREASSPAKTADGYGELLGNIAGLLDEARRTSARAVNALMTATYWEIGRRIVEFEQGGETRAAYGARMLERLSGDLTTRFGRGFSPDNLENMRRFYLAFVSVEISETASRESEDRKSETASRKSGVVRASRKLQTAPATSRLIHLAARFPLPWSAYVRLLSLKSDEARHFYEAEALRGGWSVRQLARQIDSQFYERTALSRNKAAVLETGTRPLPGDTLSPEEEIKDPYVLEFLGLKDEYSESELEDALIRHLEAFLLELGGDFCFVGRQKRLRIGDDAQKVCWYASDSWPIDTTYYVIPRAQVD